MSRNITIEGINEFLSEVGDYIEPYNFDIILGLAKLTNSIEKAYKIYINNIFEGYSIFLGKDISEIKKDIIYRSKKELPIKFLYETDKDRFIDTVNKLDGEELEYYLKMNGYNQLDTGITVCI